MKVYLDIGNACYERTDRQTIGNKSERYREFGPFQLELIEKIWIVIGWKYAPCSAAALEPRCTDWTTGNPVCDRSNDWGHQNNDEQPTPLWEIANLGRICSGAIDYRINREYNGEGDQEEAHGASLTLPCEIRFVL